MGEPVSTGMMIGAALGGGGAALKGGNPLTGALIGGATGGLGGGFAGGFSGAAPIVEASGAGGLANATVQAPTFMQQLGGGAMGVKDVLGGTNAFINANPVTSQIGFGLAKDLLTPQQPQYAPVGQVKRGQIQPMDYMSLLNPQQETVMYPQSMSLL
jgi:hypothetical protein